MLDGWTRVERVRGDVAAQGGVPIDDRREAVAQVGVVARVRALIAATKDRWVSVTGMNLDVESCDECLVAGVPCLRVDGSGPATARRSFTPD
jgi:hypothetical protein